ncbi:MAG TPA: hypothetical protein VME70_06900 [Mycobacteriales bacterium]|nr:hypothetical protein [Mycobacteriales bacterium]
MSNPYAPPGSPPPGPHGNPPGPQPAPASGTPWGAGSPPGPPWGPTQPGPPWGAPPGGSRPIGAAVWVAIAVAVAIVVAAAGIGLRTTFFVTRSSPAATSAQSCRTPVPATASPATRTYAAALNTAYVGWTSITKSLISEGYVVHPVDLSDEWTTDETFMTSVARIQFPPAAAPTAQLYLSIIRSYLHLLKAARKQYAFYGANHSHFIALDTARSTLAAQLRTKLGLPASRCVVDRP